MKKNSKSKSYSGLIETKNISLVISEDFIQIKYEDNTEVLLTYNDIVLFAINENDNFIFIQFGEQSELKIYSENVKDIYEMVDKFSVKHPQTEFSNELEGDNELYTADSFK